MHVLFRNSCDNPWEHQDKMNLHALQRPSVQPFTNPYCLQALAIIWMNQKSHPRIPAYDDLHTSRMSLNSIGSSVDLDVVHAVARSSQRCRILLSDWCEFNIALSSEDEAHARESGSPSADRADSVFALLRCDWSVSGMARREEPYIPCLYPAVQMASSQASNNISFS